MSNKSLEKYYNVQVGQRLGFYTALAKSGALTSADLAAQTGTHETYVRHWVEQQINEGLLEPDRSQEQTGFVRATAGLAQLLSDKGAEWVSRCLW